MCVCMYICTHSLDMRLGKMEFSKLKQAGCLQTK